MKILHLETSSKNCSVAVSDGKELLCLCEQASENYKQSENLHVFVQWALEGAELGLQDIDAVCLGMGPGSYTGLRIGASAAKGFCYALNIPLIAVNSLDAMRASVDSQEFDLIIPMIDARRREVYCRIYDGKSGEAISETEAKVLDENSLEELAGRKILIIGDGACKASEILGIEAVYDASVMPSAKFLIESAFKKYVNSDFEDVAYFEPLYLKDFQGVKRKKSED